MLLIAFKLFLAATLFAVGLWVWRLVDRWQEQGEIPKEWIESIEPEPVSTSAKGSELFLGWQRLMAVFSWFFAMTIFLSAVFDMIEIV